MGGPVEGGPVIPRGILGRVVRSIRGIAGRIVRQVGTLEVQPQGHQLPFDAYPRIDVPQSSWVMYLDYIPTSQALDVQFKDRQKRPTALIRYPNMTAVYYYGMKNDPSKGKYVHKHLYKRPYIPVMIQRVRRNRGAT